MSKNKRKFNECDANDTPAEISEPAKHVVDKLLPDKSGRLYRQCYEQFLEWQKQQGTTSVSEETMLVYIDELSKKLKPSSLWAKYSMLKCTVFNFRNVDIGKYQKLSAFMSKNSKGFVSTKAKTLEPRDVKKFLAEAPDNRYLAIKVALILGITGACRREELKNITIHDIEHHDKIIVVKIPRTRNDVPRKFMVDGKFCDIIKKYEALRPKNVVNDRFFLCLRDGKCTQQVIGINTFGAMPRMIAEYLGLEEPDRYTGHSFRRTSATMHTDAGAVFYESNRKNDESWMPNNNSQDCSNEYVGRKKLDFEAHESSNFHTATGTAASSEVAASSFSLAHDVFQSLDPFMDVREQTHPKTARIACQTKDWTNDGPRVPDTLFCWTGQNEASTQTNIFIEPKRRPKKAQENTKKNIKCGPEMEIKPRFLGIASITSDKMMRYLAGVSQIDFHSFLQLIVPGKYGQPTDYKKVSRENRLLLFLMKIKLGLEFSALSTLFNIHRSTALLIFVEVLTTLVEQTKTWIVWPSKDSIRKNILPSFHNNTTYQCIIDCIEIPIDTPSTVEQRILMYSNYKGGFTIKFLLAITLDGFICKISKGYGGRVTDSFITNDCGLINSIENGDAVLADKGFLQIKSELAKRSSSLVISPFASNSQFAAEKIDESYKTASVGINVERAIQRVKLSGILKHITADLLPYVDAIMHMCCVIANTQPSPLKDDVQNR